MVHNTQLSHGHSVAEAKRTSHAASKTICLALQLSSLAPITLSDSGLSGLFLIRNDPEVR